MFKEYMLSDTVDAVAGVYSIMDLITGQCYIGSSSNMQQRKGAHASKLANGKHNCKDLQDLYNLHKEYFRFYVLEYVDNVNELLVIERAWSIIFQELIVNIEARCTIESYKEVISDKYNNSSIDELNKLSTDELNIWFKSFMRCRLQHEVGMRLYYMWKPKR